MVSDFKICVKHIPSGTFVEWEPGLALEKDLIEELAERTAAKGVGFLRSTAHVVADLKEALTELLFDLKSKV